MNKFDQQMPGEPTPIKKKKKWPFIIGAILVIGILAQLTDTGDANEPDSTSTAKPSSSQTEIVSDLATERPTEKPTEAPTETPTEEPTEEPTEKPTEATTVLPEYAVLGESWTSDDITVAFVGLTASEGSQFNQPSSGNVFLLPEFEITNDSSADIAVSSMMSFEFYVDDYATSISLLALIEKDGPQLDGSIAAGRKMRGSVGIEVPADYQKLEIIFNPSLFGNNEFKFIHEP